MKNRWLKRMAAGLFTVSIFMTACSNDKEDSDEHSDEYLAQLEEARTTPYGRYPETIKYTLGKLTGSNNSNLPYGETYENNAYTRRLLDILNVQNVDIFEAGDSSYDSNVSMAIASEQLPDIMVVSSIEDLQLLIEYDLIEDLSEAYENCMTETIKDIYSSYDGILEAVTFDGKIMAIPETNIGDGPNLIWLRKDWIDDLGLEEPKTLEDVEYIVSQFIEKDPGNNGEGNTVGIVCDAALCGECGYSSEYLLDIVFSSYDAYPKQWIYDEDGNVVYGSVQPEAKEALAHINEMYNTGILDSNFLIRESSNIIDIIVNGQCGSFFGPWWAPNNPLMKAVEKNPDAKWQPYLIATNDDGTTSYYSQNPSYKYVVVKKGYEYPEIACKVVSTLFDYMRYDIDGDEELESYYQKNVDPTARPVAINVDYNNALSLCYNEISSALNGDKLPEELNLLEYSYYVSCASYLENPDKSNSEEWAAYTSRITACSLLEESLLNQVQSLFFGETDTMASEWWKLKDYEEQIYLKIVTGDISIDDFDSFVEYWNSEGGSDITEEVREIISQK